MHTEYIHDDKLFEYNKINASVIGYHAKVLIKSNWCKSIHACIWERWNNKKNIFHQIANRIKIFFFLLSSRDIYCMCINNIKVISRVTATCTAEQLTWRLCIKENISSWSICEKLQDMHKMLWNACWKKLSIKSFKGNISLFLWNFF